MPSPPIARLLRSDAAAFALVSVVVALLAAAVFTPGLPGTFVFDDIPNIVNNRSIHLNELSAAAVVDVLATPQPSGSLRGLATLSFALDYWRGGGADAATFKTTNIVIHALTALALAWFFRQLLLITGIASHRAGWLATALALAWAMHPLLVSSVLYVVQRLQTLGTLFLVLALIAWLQARHEQIQGRSGRAGVLGALLLWALAMGCKEDSVLLPAYALALELTVLRFAAADPGVALRLRRGFLVAVVLAAAAYLLWLLPSWWHWDPYPGRDFNSAERLLTQARVLCLYLWQILWPLPQHMSFHYDWIEPSRGLLQPWTTLPAIVLITALLALAWRVRHRWPLFSLGVMLFFSAHVVASNVVGLELAYEHRNHFALIGAVLATGSVLAALVQRLRWPAGASLAAGVVLLVALTAATVLRAYSWRDAVSQAQAATVAAPTSPRAWIELCDALFKAGGGVRADNLRLDEAIAACAAGAEARPDSLNNLALLVVLKTQRGDVSARDWERLQQRLETVRLSWDNARAPLILVHYLGQGVSLATEPTIRVLATLDRRTALRPATLLSIGDAIANELGQPDRALQYYLKIVETLPPGDPFAWEQGAALRARGWQDLADAVERAGHERRARAMVAPASKSTNENARP